MACMRSLRLLAAAAWSSSSSPLLSSGCRRECGLYGRRPFPLLCSPGPSRGISLLTHVVPKKKNPRPRFWYTRLKKKRIIGNLVKRPKRLKWAKKRMLDMEVRAVTQLVDEEKKKRRAMEDRPLVLQLRRQRQRAVQRRRILGEQSTYAAKAADVYSELTRLRAAGKPLSQLNYDGIERWFRSDTACFAGRRRPEDLGREQVASALESNDGVFHGLGWLGSGRWDVQLSTINDAGVCQRCHQQLSAYKVEGEGADKLARRMAKLAAKSAHRQQFERFSEWLSLSSYDTIVDGVSLRRSSVYSKTKLVRRTTFHDILKSTVEELRKHSLRFLVVMDTDSAHANGNSPVVGDPKLFLYQMKRAKELYTVAKGMDSTWFSLYAAIKHGCMLVSNDDALEKPRKLLSASMLLTKWLDRHQVRFDLPMQMTWPPAYSLTIQESMEGAWHVPSYSAGDLMQQKPWLCITRPRVRRRLLA